MREREVTIRLQQKYFVVAEKIFKTQKYYICSPDDRFDGEKLSAMSVTVSQLFKGKGEPRFSSQLETRTEADY